MKKILIILLFLFSHHLYSQNKDVIYLDENSREISSSEFKKKKSSLLFNIAVFHNKHKIFKKLRYREYFGKLKDKKEFYAFVLEKHKLDSTKTWLIRYTDTLPNLKELPEKTTVKFIDSTNYFLTFNEFRKKRKNIYSPKKHRLIMGSSDYINQLQVEKKDIKNKAELIRFYNFNRGVSLEYLVNFNFIKDKQSIIKEKFSDQIAPYKTIILFSNGDFYATSLTDHYYEELKLLNRRKFNSYKKKWLKRISRTQ